MWVITRVANKLNVKESEMWDLTPFQPDWNEVEYFDGFRDHVPRGVTVFINPPFSMSKAWRDRAVDLFVNNDNSVVCLMLDTTAV
jgi:hypothetical protein